MAPEALYPLYDEIHEGLRQQGVLSRFQTLAGTTPVALDGTWYFSSEKIHCGLRSKIDHKSADDLIPQRDVTPVIVAPGQKHAIALRPEFIVPQDGHDKQDCEINAAKRWIDKEAGRYLQALNRNVTFWVTTSMPTSRSAATCCSTAGTSSSPASPPS